LITSLDPAVIARGVRLQPDLHSCFRVRRGVGASQFSRPVPENAN